MKKDTLEEWILNAADGEEITGVVFGKPDYYLNWPIYPPGKLMSFEEALPWLRIGFYSDVGSPPHPQMHAWTKSWVIGTDNHDGLTSCFRIPRNPRDFDPCEPGAG